MTDHVLSFLSAYQETLQHAFSLPDELKTEYELHDCLRESQEKSVYLVRSKKDGSFAVLKHATGSAREHLRAEYELLQQLHAVSFPRAISYDSNSRGDFFLREYIEGVPVSAYVEKNGPFPEAIAVRLICGLCEPLASLHTQTPPIIHRDIKPQNVILTKQQTLVLIDFDTARHFHAEQKTDTVFLGTQMTAAPEQFGYQQTDQRSDVYSTGILLLYLCTGSYAREDSARIQKSALRRIVKKSTRFDPARRFHKMEHLRKSLCRAQRASKPQTVICHSVCAGLLLGLAIAFALMFSGALPQIPAQKTPAASPDVAAAAMLAVRDTISFESPELEHAVRKQLGLDEQTPLKQADLDRITSLYLFGTKTLFYWDDVNYYSLYQSSTESGEIDTLADIPKLRNLTELSLGNQQIVDLSPLSGMRLTRLALGGNQISDCSALASLPLLQELYIGYNPIYDIGVLRGLTRLQVVDLCHTAVSDLSPLSSNITALYLTDTPVLDYEPLLGMPGLQTLYLSHADQRCLSVMSRLTTLTRLEVSRNITSIRPFLSLTNLTSLAISQTQLTSIAGIEALDHLNYFRIMASPYLDLTPLTNMPSITALDIYSEEIDDYSVILQIPNLKTLYCTSAQKDALEALDLPIYFEIHAL